MREPQPLPEDVQVLCSKLDAPPRLMAHLRLVHDTAVDLLKGLDASFPGLPIDCHAVLFGAASHDLGKMLHLDELSMAGNRHEQDGPELLERHGICPSLARFARTHAAWERDNLPLDDLLVATADTIWKGTRLEGLENMLVQRIAHASGKDAWEVFVAFDDLLTRIASAGDDRLAWQRQF